jgi:predicted Zn finger-like uncharacterized protein
MSLRDAASMILSCPACATRYRVAEQEFEGAAGRTVRCANCGHLWYATASGRQMPGGGEPSGGEPVGEAPAEPTAAPDEAAIEAVAPPVPRLEAPPRPRPAPPQKAGPRLAPAAWIIAIVVLLVAVTAAGMLVRHRLSAAWPSAARQSSSAGHAAEPSGTGLVIRRIAPTRTADGLVIDGEVANLGDASHDVPRLRVALQDSTEKEIQFKTVDPPKPQLQPGEVMHFETPFAHPPDAATCVVVTFASP